MNWLLKNINIVQTCITGKRKLLISLKELNRTQNQWSQLFTKHENQKKSIKVWFYISLLFFFANKLSVAHEMIFFSNILFVLKYSNTFSLSLSLFSSIIEQIICDKFLACVFYRFYEGVNQVKKFFGEELPVLESWPLLSHLVVDNKSGPDNFLFG